MPTHTRWCSPIYAVSQFYKTLTPPSHQPCPPLSPSPAMSSIIYLYSIWRQPKLSSRFDNPRSILFRLVDGGGRGGGDPLWIFEVEPAKQLGGVLLILCCCIHSYYYQQCNRRTNNNNNNNNMINSRLLRSHATQVKHGAFISGFGIWLELIDGSSATDGEHGPEIHLRLYRYSHQFQQLMWQFENEKSTDSPTWIPSGVN